MRGGEEGERKGARKITERLGSSPLESASAPSAPRSASVPRAPSAPRWASSGRGRSPPAGPCTSMSDGVRVRGRAAQARAARRTPADGRTSPPASRRRPASRAQAPARRRRGRPRRPRRALRGGGARPSPGGPRTSGRPAIRATSMPYEWSAPPGTSVRRKITLPSCSCTCTRAFWTRAEPVGERVELVVVRGEERPRRRPRRARGGARRWPTRC